MGAWRAAMKRYMLLHVGFEMPTPEIMAAWKAWFESLADRSPEHGGFHGGARELTRDEARDLAMDAHAITGYSIIDAESLDDAEAVASGRPKEKKRVDAFDVGGTAPRVEVARGSFTYHDLGHGGEAAGASEHLAGDAGSEDGGHGAFARSAIGGMTLEDQNPAQIGLVPGASRTKQILQVKNEL